MKPVFNRMGYVRSCSGQILMNSKAKTLYEILEVNPTDDVHTIRESWLKLAKKYFPSAKSGNQEMFDLITDAWRVLCDENDRALYDQSLKDREP